MNDENADSVGSETKVSIREMVFFVKLAFCASAS